MLDALGRIIAVVEGVATGASILIRGVRDLRMVMDMEVAGGSE